MGYSFILKEHLRDNDHSFQMAAWCDEFIILALDINQSKTTSLQWSQLCFNNNNNSNKNNWNHV